MTEAVTPHKARLTSESSSTGWPGLVACLTKARQADGLLRDQNLIGAGCGLCPGGRAPGRARHPGPLYRLLRLAAGSRLSLPVATRS